MPRDHTRYQRTRTNPAKQPTKSHKNRTKLQKITKKKSNAPYPLPTQRPIFKGKIRRFYVRAREKEKFCGFLASLVRLTVLPRPTRPPIRAGPGSTSSLSRSDPSPSGPCGGFDAGAEHETRVGRADGSVAPAGAHESGARPGNIPRREAIEGSKDQQISFV